ncbi:hypothetical protein [Yoonia sediminilitoris]|uniref:Uncharacterized protein n=1 Tax=Yoonia sediminilitoris TaxID=1286148 RepID=A0A2T6K0Y6_9RHOB|nr:hypothetical protein [Yoonia sediminilitoris]PUB08313.1 hypothetical protein C8N45_1401 [Yoonia sediminilitoris]RCW89417.1 hypothetical protein DFP92_1391 [Yoonia sediminilitoris]
MSFLRFRRVIMMVSVCFISVLSALHASAQTLTGSNVDSRVLVAMQFENDAVQAMMPEGWTLFPFPSGALKGANSLLIFADRYLGMDAEGKPNDPASYRAIAMASLGKSTTTDEVRTFVTKVFATVDGNDPYGNARLANISRSSSVESNDSAPPKLTEEWSMNADGGELSLSLAYTAGPLSWAARESQSYSNVDSTIHHLNRFEQLSDLAMSAPLGRALNGDLEISSSIPELAALFSGAERTIAVIVIPMYVREVFEP